MDEELKEEEIKEEEVKEKEKPDYRIQEEDFIMEPVKGSSWFFNVVFFKKVKDKKTGEYKIKPGDKMYGLPLECALRRIAHCKCAKKFYGRKIQLREFMKEFDKTYKEMLKLCHDTAPERLNY